MKTLFISLITISIFMACNSNKPSERNQNNYIEKGIQITGITQDTLKKELFAAIQKNGVEGAIEYCNLNAELITSIYEKENVSEISRTALKYRNPDNAPDSIELEHLNKFNDAIVNGKNPEPQLYHTEKIVHYFQPIVLNNACLVCHGSPENEIPPKAFEQINKMYSNDKAINFKEGDLRGIWHVVFNK